VDNLAVQGHGYAPEALFLGLVLFPLMIMAGGYLRPINK
jgi:hypothetical protein